MSPLRAAQEAAARYAELDAAIMGAVAACPGLSGARLEAEVEGKRDRVRDRARLLVNDGRLVCSFKGNAKSYTLPATAPPTSPLLPPPVGGGARGRDRQVGKTTSPTSPHLAPGETGEILPLGPEGAQS